MKDQNETIELSDDAKLKFAGMVIHVAIGIVILIATAIHYYFTEVY